MLHSWHRHGLFLTYQLAYLQTQPTGLCFQGHGWFAGLKALETNQKDSEPAQSSHS